MGRRWWTQTQDEDRGVGSGRLPGGGWKFELTVRPRDLTQGSEFPLMITAEPSLLIRSFFILHSLTYSQYRYGVPTLGQPRVEEQQSTR